MFKWGEFARQFGAFRAASEAQGGGAHHGPDFWARALVARWEGAAAPDREMILRDLDEGEGRQTFGGIIEAMDAKYASRVSEDALEKRWASFPLPGPEEHHLKAWYTRWCDIAKSFEPSGAR